MRESIGFLGSRLGQYVQGSFLYDSKKAAGVTRSFLRLSDAAIDKSWSIQSADFLLCASTHYLKEFDLFSSMKEGGVLLINAESGTESDVKKFVASLTGTQRETIQRLNLSLYLLDAFEIAHTLRMKRRVGAILLPALLRLIFVREGRDESEIEEIQQELEDRFERTYQLKGQVWQRRNREAVSLGFQRIKEIPVEEFFSETPLHNSTDNSPRNSAHVLPSNFERGQDPFLQRVEEPMRRFEGDRIPVSALPVDGRMSLGSTAREKRRIANYVSSWSPDSCVQCNKCVMACPHAVIRSKQIDPNEMQDSPEGFKSLKSTTKNGRDLRYRLQISIEDCTGCGVCIDVCPVTPKALTFKPFQEEKSRGAIKHFEYFEQFPYEEREGTSLDTLRGSQFLQPLFEYSSACAGCGETPYLKLVTQLFGERAVIANATGCSSIFSGSFPSTPYTTSRRSSETLKLGPVWSNSLFENNAEYALGIRLSVEKNREDLRRYLEEWMKKNPDPKNSGFDIKMAIQHTLDLWYVREPDEIEEGIQAQIALSLLLEEERRDPLLEKIESLKHYLSPKSVWAIGGDGWAYDIDFSGLNHVLNGDDDLNILVLDTQGYANTGGQSSKATPMGAQGKFSTRGKGQKGQDLGEMFLSQERAYIASVSLGGNFKQTLTAFLEAEKFDGPSLILAYSPCIAHGIEMMESNRQMKRAVDSGFWPLYRYNPQRPKTSRFSLDSPPPDWGELDQFYESERRFHSLFELDSEMANELKEKNKEELKRRRRLLESWQGL